MLNRILALVGLASLLWTGALLVDATPPARTAVSDVQVLADAEAEAARQFSYHGPNALGRYLAKRQLQRVLKERWGSEVVYAIDDEELTAFLDGVPAVVHGLQGGGWVLVRSPQAPISMADHRVERLKELTLRPPFLAVGVLALVCLLVLPRGPRKQQTAPASTSMSATAAAESWPRHPELEAYLTRLNSLAAAHAASDELADKVRHKTAELRELLQSVPEQVDPAQLR